MSDTVFTLTPPLVHAVQDAVLLGNIRELDGLLDMVSEDAAFPPDLRHALEALLYFRIHYGRGGMLEPVGDLEKLRVAQMESVWNKELIAMTGHYPDMTEAKYA